jgi:hypothetical protein
MCAKLREEGLHLNTLFIVNTLTPKSFENPKPFGGKEFSLSKESQTYFFLCLHAHIKREKK